LSVASAPITYLGSNKYIIKVLAISRPKIFRWYGYKTSRRKL